MKGKKDVNIVSYKAIESFIEHRKGMECMLLC